MNIIFWQIIGLSAAVLTTFSFIPQIIKVVKTKSAKDVSLITLLQLTAGVILWTAYGVYLKDKIIILANGVTFLSLFTLLVLFFKYGRMK